PPRRPRACGSGTWYSSTCRACGCGTSSRPRSRSRRCAGSSGSGCIEPGTIRAWSVGWPRGTTGAPRTGNAGPSEARLPASEPAASGILGAETERSPPEVGRRPLFLSKGSFGVREKEVGDLVRPVVEAAGLELWEVSFGREGGRRILRVMGDRPAGHEPAGGDQQAGGDEKLGGVDLDTIAATSQRLSRRLDLEGFEQDRPYELEVSSPGLARLPRAPRRLSRSVGHTVRGNRV